MEEKKIQNKNVLFLFLIIIILIGGFLVYNNFNNKEEQKVVLEKSPIEITNNDDGTKTVRNVEEDVQLIVGEEWEVTKNSGLLINVLFRGEEQPKFDTDFVDGINFSIKKLSSNVELDIKKWLLNNSQYNKTEIDKMEIINIKNVDMVKISQEFNDEEYLPINFVNQRFDYLFNDENYLLDYSCDILSEISKIDDYKDKCEELIKQNIK